MSSEIISIYDETFKSNAVDVYNQSAAERYDGNNIPYRSSICRLYVFLYIFNSRDYNSILPQSDEEVGVSRKFKGIFALLHYIKCSGD